LKSGLSRETKTERVGHGIVVDRQEEISVQIVGCSDAFEEARLGLALGHEQSGFCKAFGLQFLLDPLRKAQIEDKLGDVSGAGRAFRFGGMSDIESDPEFRAIADRSGRLQGTQVGRPEGGKLYRVGLSRSGGLGRDGRLSRGDVMLGRFAVLRRALEHIRQPAGSAGLDRQKHTCGHHGDDDRAAPNVEA